MNELKAIVFVFILHMIASCSNRYEQPINIAMSDVSFHTGFPTHIKCYGSYFDKKYGEELVFFADPKSSRCLKTFNLKGELKDSISLTGVISDKLIIDAINIYSRDTIVVNSYYPNSIYMLDHSGHVWKTIFLDDMVQWKDSTIDQAEYWSSTQPNSIFAANGTIYLSNQVFVKMDPHETDKVKTYKRIFDLMHRKPYFLKVDNIFSESTAANTELNDYYSLFTDEYESDSFVIPFFHTTDSLIFLFAPFSDKILYYPHGKPEQMATFTITSDYSDIGFAPIKVSAETVDSLGEIMSRTAQANGGITRFFYHPQTQVYSVITSLDKPENKTIEENYYDRRFSLHILNKEFKKIAEQDYSYKGYDFGGDIPTEDAILIKKRNDSNNPMRHEKIEYSHVRFNR